MNINMKKQKKIYKYTNYQKGFVFNNLKTK